MVEMTALEYIKEKARMTKRCEMACACCLLHGYNNSTGDGCSYLEYKQMVGGASEKDVFTGFLGKVSEGKVE